MTGYLLQAAEEQFGIKADPDDVEKLYSFIRDAYGRLDPEIIDKVFSSGEAAGFLTVSETYFFREPAHFSFLLDLLPSYEKTGIRICSAAAANGCEAYSIAMLIEAYNRGVAPIPYHIDAFDVNPKAIEAACRGIYSGRTLRDDGSCFRYMADPYLKKLGNGYSAGALGFDLGSQYQVDPSLKQNISFFVHNVMHELPPKEYDLVFFRNAFIYFLPRHRERVLSNLAAVLKEGGILILGVSETAGVRHAGIHGKNRNDVFYFEKAVPAGNPAAAEP
jgi:chemotaxis protein methyltransferase CheR